MGYYGLPWDYLGVNKLPGHVSAPRPTGSPASLRGCRLKEWLRLKMRMADRRGPVRPAPSSCFPSALQRPDARGAHARQTTSRATDDVDRSQDASRRMLRHADRRAHLNARIVTSDAPQRMRSLHHASARNACPTSSRVRESGNMPPAGALSIDRGEHCLPRNHLWRLRCSRDS
jgi:hypothetical protein